MKIEAKSDLTIEAHNLKSRINLLARLASVHLQYSEAERLRKIENKAILRFERRLYSIEWA
jgi:hypothetical protein